MLLSNLDTFALVSKFFLPKKLGLKPRPWPLATLRERWPLATLRERRL
ncbi:MAG: hypothetical protein F6K56_20305 [Moorea sp. SIO3G5]|nr:hypothetical protein [Moorena sp. SIO3G5]